MKNVKMFCLSLEPGHYEFVKKLGYIPVGLGEKNFSKNWFTDKSGVNISEKNRYYGEYTFHYWLWKNYLDQMNDEWIGFCQYRKFWSLKQYKTEKINFSNLILPLCDNTTALIISSFQSIFMFFSSLFIIKDKKLTIFFAYKDEASFATLPGTLA